MIVDDDFEIDIHCRIVNDIVISSSDGYRIVRFLKLMFKMELLTPGFRLGYPELTLDDVVSRIWKSIEEGRYGLEPKDESCRIWSGRAVPGVPYITRSSKT